MWNNPPPPKNKQTKKKNPKIHSQHANAQKRIISEKELYLDFWLGVAEQKNGTCPEKEPR